MPPITPRRRRAYLHGGTLLLLLLRLLLLLLLLNLLLLLLGNARVALSHLNLTIDFMLRAFLMFCGVVHVPGSVYELALLGVIVEEVLTVSVSQSLGVTHDSCGFCGDEVLVFPRVVNFVVCPWCAVNSDFWILA